MIHGLIGTIVCLLCGTWAQAAADERAPPLTQQVRIDDLDLSVEAGARAAYVRIQSAARAVCNALHGKEQHSAVAWKDCYRLAVSEAVANINNTALNALHRSMTASADR